MKTLTYIRNDITAHAIPTDNPKGHMTTVHIPEHNLYIHNVYRPQKSKDDSWVHQQILGARDDRAVFIGDFNRIGLQTLETLTDGNQEQASDMELLSFLFNNYPILNNLDEPSRNNVLLDLSCSRIPGAYAFIDHDADAGSDHLPITTVIPTTTRRRKKPIGERMFNKKSITAPGPDSEAPFLTTFRKLSEENTPTSTLDLMELIKKAIDENSKWRYHKRRRTHPFWDDECQKHREELLHQELTHRLLSAPKGLRAPC